MIKNQLAGMTTADFRDHIRQIAGPALPTVKPTVRTPEDRGYFPPTMRDETLEGVLASGKTIWNSDGTDGPVLICAPPTSAKGAK